jgi:hypothetical protein
MDEATDELEIQHGLSGRDASPCFERTVRRAVETSFKSLFETKNLYQKETVDLSSLETEIARDAPSLKEEALSSLRREALLRPWRVSTHHQGDDRSTAEILGLANLGCDPLGTPDEDRTLYFFAPGVRLTCGKCEDKTTFEALHCSGEGNRFGAPYPRVRGDKREQVFLFYYRCVSCRDFIHSILALRQGLRIHLCGVAPRRQLATPLQIGGKLQQIADDAHNAVLEGDLFAGLYHLRTLIEHYIKGRLDIKLTEQIRGEELVARYNASLAEPLKAAIPSLAPAYEELSKCLHSRSGVAADFERIEGAVRHHIEAVRTLERYHNNG